MTTVTPLKQAHDAAVKEFDRYLDASRSGAASYVPQCVTDVAEKVFRAAGGTGDIVVCGRGNTTHPVCSVYVKRAK